MSPWRLKQANFWPTTIPSLQLLTPKACTRSAQTWFVITSHEEAKILTGNLHFFTYTEVLVRLLRHTWAGECVNLTTQSNLKKLSSHFSTGKSLTEISQANFLQASTNHRTASCYFLFGGKWGKGSTPTGNSGGFRTRWMLVCLVQLLIHAELIFWRGYVKHRQSNMPIFVSWAG